MGLIIVPKPSHISPQHSCGKNLTFLCSAESLSEAKYDHLVRRTHLSQALKTIAFALFEMYSLRMRKQHGETVGKQS